MGKKNDGGWDSVYSTSWAMRAMNALGVSWTKGENTIGAYLGNLQTEDGAVSPASETTKPHLGDKLCYRRSLSEAMERNYAIRFQIRKYCGQSRTPSDTFRNNQWFGSYSRTIKLLQST